MILWGHENEFLVWAAKARTDIADELYKKLQAIAEGRIPAS